MHVWTGDSDPRLARQEKVGLALAIRAVAPYEADKELDELVAAVMPYLADKACNELNRLSAAIEVGAVGITSADFLDSDSTEGCDGR